MNKPSTHQKELITYWLEKSEESLASANSEFHDGLLQSLDEPDKTIEEIQTIEAEKRLEA
jgi:hypothetical protein